MRELGADEITAWIGPHVCGRCYEVPESMRAEVAAVVPESFAETSWGTPALDIGAGVRAQLARAGVTVVEVGRLHPRGPRAPLLPPRRLPPPVGFAGAGAGVLTMTQRADELAANLVAVRRRIDVACEAAGRDAGEVTLTVVTKFFPASDVRILADLGVTDVGENRHQEAAAKAAECADLPLRWHFIGGLQSNKAAAVASYADVVESLDRPKLVAGLQRGAHERGHGVDVLLQVSLDPPGAEHRAGADPAELSALAAAVEAVRVAATARPDGRRTAR